MGSPVFTDHVKQMSLALDETLVQRFRCLRDCVAQGVYQRGLKTVAMDLEESPGNLSSQLSDHSQRKFDVDALERYIQVTGDKTPIYYLIARFMADEGAARDHALQQVADLLQQLPTMLAAAGLEQGAPAVARKGRR